MSQINDCILAATGGPTVNDGLLAYYRLNGATPDANTLQDAERQFLLEQEATPSTNQDMWFEYLRGLGYTGALDDMRLKYWCALAAPGCDGYDFCVSVVNTTSDIFGYDNAVPTGAMLPSEFEGLFFHRFTGNATNFNLVMNFGDDGEDQIPEADEIQVQLAGLPGIAIAPWLPESNRYQIADQRFSEHIVANEGFDLGITLSIPDIIVTGPVITDVQYTPLPVPVFVVTAPGADEISWVAFGDDGVEIDSGSTGYSPPNEAVAIDDVATELTWSVDFHALKDGLAGPVYTVTNP